MITRCGHARERKSDYRFRCMGGNRQWLRVRDAYGDMDNKDYTVIVIVLHYDCPSRCPANSNYRMPIMSQRPPLKMEDVVQVRRGEHSARSCH